MMKTHGQRASSRKRKHWAQKARKANGTRTMLYAVYSDAELNVLRQLEDTVNGKSVIGTALHEQLEESVPDVPSTGTYTVLVKLASETRAKRLTADGKLTTRKSSAVAFTSEAEAITAVSNLLGEDWTSDQIERAWVATF